MAIILYGGTGPTVKRQLECAHQWHGPCMDKVSRYFKCLKCFCLERDLKDEKAYWAAEREAADGEKNVSESHSDVHWSNAKDELRRAVTAAWQAEMLKEPEEPEREATTDEMLRWTGAARARLMLEIDRILYEAVGRHGR